MTPEAPMPPVAKTGLVLVLLYASYCALLFLMQRQMIFPRHLSGGPAAAAGPDVAVVWLDTPEGRVEAWFLPVQAQGLPHSGPWPAIIFAHGNAERIDLWADPFRSITRRGVAVLLVEYPGYGRSQGAPSQAAITRTMIAAHDYLRGRRDVDPDRIVFLGRSIGAGAVCSLAAERPPAALVLLSAFKSTRAMAYRFLAPGFLIRDPFDNLAVVSSYPGPVLVVHGRRDDIIPYAHGVALSRAAPRGRLITYEAAHNDCPPDWERFCSDLLDFLVDAGILEPVGV
jgi:pimeloyl-ACP methyl ester carboxylesterase